MSQVLFDSTAGGLSTNVLGVFMVAGLRRASRRLRRISDITAAVDLLNGDESGVNRFLRQRGFRKDMLLDGSLALASLNQSPEHSYHGWLPAPLCGKSVEGIRLVVVVENNVLFFSAVGGLAIVAALDGQTDLTAEDPWRSAIYRCFCAGQRWPPPSRLFSMCTRGESDESSIKQVVFSCNGEIDEKMRAAFVVHYTVVITSATCWDNSD